MQRAENGDQRSEDGGDDDTDLYRPHVDLLQGYYIILITSALPLWASPFGGALKTLGSLLGAFWGFLVPLGSILAASWELLGAFRG